MEVYACCLCIPSNYLILFSENEKVKKMNWLMLAKTQYETRLNFALVIVYNGL